MVGIAEISAGFGSLQAAMGIVKGLQGAATQAAVNDAKIGLQEHILAAQSSLSAAQEAHTADAQRIAELEQEIVRLKEWSTEKERYELADTGQGALAYRPKESVDDGQPAHWICPNCYEDGKKSYLQPEREIPGAIDHLLCHRCSLDIIAQGYRNQRPKR